jgi:hypothetical protein
MAYRTFDLFLVLLETRGEVSQSSIDVVTQWSPYSNETYMVEMRWTLSFSRQGGYCFSASATILDGTGAPLNPRHTLESLTTVLVTAHPVRIVENAMTL